MLNLDTFRPKNLRDKPTDQTDEAGLVQAACAGDDEAFTALLEIYWTPIQSYLLRMTGEAELAADLTQESFFKAYQAMRRLDDPQNLVFRPWLYKIATNLAISHRRRKQYRGWLSLDLWRNHSENAEILADESATLLEQTLAAETGQQVVRTLAKLPAAQTALLLLRFYQDLTIEEIGEVLGLAPNTVRARLHRARLSFRRIYARMNKQESL